MKTQEEIDIEINSKNLEVLEREISRARKSGEDCEFYWKNYTSWEKNKMAQELSSYGYKITFDESYLRIIFEKK